METALPSEFYIILSGKPRNRLLVPAHNNPKCCPNCRDAPGNIHLLSYANYCMNMIRHYHKHRNFHIRIMRMESCKRMICKFAYIRKFHFTILYLTKIMFFIMGADSYKIITS